MPDQHAATARLLWGPHPEPSRGPRRTLTLDGIARAGIGLADTEGLAALSMQRVAERLGVTKMALYRYVPGRTELVALMVEAAIGMPPEPGTARGTRGGDGPSGGWRERLEEWARALAEAFRAHPWALDATLGPRVMGPAELAWMERAVTALDGTGLTGPERMDAAVLVVGHVRSIAEQQRAAGSGTDAEARLAQVLGAVLREHGERFPAVAAALAGAGGTGPPGEGRDQAWEFGLARILDGLEVLVERRGGGG